MALSWRSGSFMMGVGVCVLWMLRWARVQLGFDGRNGDASELLRG